MNDALFSTMARILDPKRKCPVPDCTKTVRFGDFACSEEHERAVSLEIAAALAPGQRKEPTP